MHLHMADVGIFGLATGALLFLLPSAIYLTFGVRCLMTDGVASEETSGFCENVNSETALTLTLFGVLFLVCGVLTSAFTVFIWLRGTPTTTNNKPENGKGMSPKQNLHQRGLWV